MVEKVQKAQARLYPTKIARDGSIMEWVCEKLVFIHNALCFNDSSVVLLYIRLFKCNKFYAFSIWWLLLWWQAQDFEDPEVHHRHVSHLFGLFPGHTITVEETPDLSKAADYTLIKRGVYENWVGKRFQSCRLHLTLEILWCGKKVFLFGIFFWGGWGGGPCCQPRSHVSCRYSFILQNLTKFDLLMQNRSL